MAKEVNKKYSVGSEVKVLKTHFLNDGVILEESTGVISGFDTKTNKYVVNVNAVGGGTLEEKYSEYEIILQDLSQSEATAEYKKLNEDIARLKKKQSTLSILLVLIVLVVMVVVASVSFILMKEENAFPFVPITMFSTLVVIIIAIACISPISKNIVKEIQGKYRKLEEMKMASTKEDVQENKSEAISDPLSDLERLKKLYDGGAITKEEYETTKEKLLKKF